MLEIQYFLNGFDGRKLVSDVRAIEKVDEMKIQHDCCASHVQHGAVR